MTKEDRDLLLKDLCERLPHDVVAQYTAGDGSTTIDCHIDCISIRSQCVGITDSLDKPFVWRDIASIKPYLRPMSSITEKEKKKVCSLNGISLIELNERLEWDIYIKVYTIETFDYFNAKHLDYRGLTEKGIALEAPENMYK